MAQQHGLSWGVFDFVSPELDPPDDGYAIHAMANGTTFGNPEADYQTLQSLLRDGAAVVRGGRKNRPIQIRLAISAPAAIAGPALVAGEAALANQVEMDSPPPLAATPSLTDAATAYFDVVIARDLEWDTSEGWDFDERVREVWYFALTLECLPFPRTENKVVIPALPVPPDPEEPAVWVDIDTCDSTAGWGYNVQHYGSGWTSTFGVVSGAVRAGASYMGGATTVYQGLLVERTYPISMDGLPYLVVDARVSHPGIYGPIAYNIDGTQVFPAATQPLGNGGVRAWIATSGVGTRLRVIASLVASGPDTGSSPRWIEVSNIARTDTIGDTTTSTTRQQSRLVEVRGAAPTQAAIRLYDATPAPLGAEILVHASRNAAWQPPLRAWRVTSEPVSSDDAMVSGARNTLATDMVFRIPANLLTEGTYALRGRMNVTSAGDFGWSLKIVSSDGSDVVGSSLMTSGSREIPDTDGSYLVFELADLALAMGKPEGNQMIQLTISGTADMAVDELWLFGLDDGVLNWLRDTESMTWIEIRSAVLGAENDCIYGGSGAPGVGGVDVSYKAGGAGYGSIGVPEIKPGLMQIFTVVTASLATQSEIEFYPRGHSHVLDEWAV